VSLVENDKLDEARTLIRKAGSKSILPEDVVVADGMDRKAQKYEMMQTLGVETTAELIRYSLRLGLIS
jgi:3-phosphoglycerate kinase